MERKVSKGVKKQILNIAFLLALISVTVVILFLSNRELDFLSIGDFFKHSKPWYLVAAFACMLGFIFFEALSLHIICRSFGHKCKVTSSLVYSASDIYYSAITPSAAGGQPASAYYMVQDGMSAGSATFALILNLIGYTAAIIILGAVAFIVNSAMFVQLEAFAKILIIIGVAIQLILLGFFIACMFCSGAMLRMGNGIISLFCKLHIVKDKEKWRGKWSGAIEKYRGSLGILKKHKLLFVVVIALNILQKASQVLITCFVCKAVVDDVPFLDIFIMQIYVTLGYNSIPLPGGVGAFEYIYLQVFTLRFDKAFLIVAMMVTRAISYYISLILSGAITLTYHFLIMKRKKNTIIAEQAETAECEEEHGESRLTDENCKERKWEVAPEPVHAKSLKFIYKRFWGAIPLRIATSRTISKRIGKYMDSRKSCRKINKFINDNNIDMSQYEECEYKSFNEFFTRKIRPELRPFDMDDKAFVAPCDGLLSLYEITPDTKFEVKGFIYTVESLLKDAELAKLYEGGLCFVFRLTVRDYHRYYYLDDCEKEENIFIKGRLHTVQHIALKARKVFTENCREFTVMHTENFGDVTQVEVGALGVGKIVNYDGAGEFKRGSEKGRFEYGGSTIIVLTQRGKVVPDEELIGNTHLNKETIVRCGEKLGVAATANLEEQA